MSGIIHADSIMYRNAGFVVWYSWPRKVASQVRNREGNRRQVYDRVSESEVVQVVMIIASQAGHPLGLVFNSSYREGSFTGSVSGGFVG